ncbi:MAG: proline iminopeptidase-family hydrolase [Gemmatimonadota bacterium]|nr:proline iminopeptidase-family hydrolase [Gemmatimonadota bacterium]
MYKTTNLGLLLIIAPVAAVACSKADKPAPVDTMYSANALGTPVDNIALSIGEGRMRVDGGRIWYRVVGTGTGMPVMLVHGGPGTNSYALKSLEELGNDRPVVRYDQLGGGKSDGLSDTIGMNIPHFVAELDSLRSALGYERVHLVGHGWGATLALEYSRAHPAHVASLTLAGAMFDMPAWQIAMKRLVATLPESSRTAIADREVDGRFNSPDYRAAIADYFQRYMWIHPVANDADSSAQHVGQRLFEFMHGPSEVTVSGTLKDYDAMSYLKEVKVPALYVVGEFDEATPALVRKYASLTPGARFVLIRDAAHFVTWDNPAATTAAVREFLNSVDRKNAVSGGRRK